MTGRFRCIMAPMNGEPPKPISWSSTTMRGCATCCAAISSNPVFASPRAGDAAEARLKLASLAFDLLIVDVMMPGESGLALTESLRADQRRADPAADRDGRAREPHRRAGARRRRLPREALRAARAGAAHPQHPAARRAAAAAAAPAPRSCVRRAALRSEARRAVSRRRRGASDRGRDGAARGAGAASPASRCRARSCRTRRNSAAMSAPSTCR